MTLPEPYYHDQHVTLYCGDCRTVLSSLPSESVDCCVTSPPYWGLRDYGTASWEGGDERCDHWPPDEGGSSHTTQSSPTTGQRQHAGRFSGPTCYKCGARRIDAQLGLEPAPDEYVASMVAVFREVKRVLRDDGTVWINLGDTYNGYMANQRATSISANNQHSRPFFEKGHGLRCELKQKDLVGIPWRIAFALQADGWYLRQDIIWSKPNPMPESVTDRCTKAHEYIFLLSKSPRYHYDADAIRETAVSGANGSEFHVAKTRKHQLDRASKKPRKSELDGINGRNVQEVNSEKERRDIVGSTFNNNPNMRGGNGTRNKRSVWTIATHPYKGAHFAVFPPDLIRPCVLAGCPAGGTILDPFLGSGTTAVVAKQEQCKCIGIELNKDYADISANRLRQGVFDF